MRLVNIGAGEITDRLTILALKIAHGQQQGKEVQHFLTERNALLVQFRAAATEIGAEHVFELAAVNAMLWQAEDEIRDYREQEGDPEKIGMGDPMLRDIVRVAFNIQSLNDRRAELVWTLNKLAGTDYGPEKL